MGFPQRNAEGFAGAAFVGEDCKLGAGGFTCPRCRARVVELPSRCGVAGRSRALLGALSSERQPLHGLGRRCLVGARCLQVCPIALTRALAAMLHGKLAPALPGCILLLRLPSMPVLAVHAQLPCVRFYDGVLAAPRARIPPPVSEPKDPILQSACACSCHVCGLTLVSSPHLARSYHHLFPVPAFAEVSADELALLQVSA